jgi:hypothetical protein
MTPDSLFEELLTRVVHDPWALNWVSTLIDIHNLPELKENDG